MISEGGHGPAGRPPAVAAEWLRHLPDFPDLGSYVVDDRGRIIEVTDRAAQLLGRAPAELLGQDAHDLLHRGRNGEPVPGTRCLMKQVLLAGRAAQGDHEWFERGDGSLMPVAWVVAPCRVGEGRTGAVMFFHELDESQQESSADSMPEVDRLALLAETTTTLTSTLNTGETLQQLVRLVVPQLADWAVVDLFTEEGNVSRAAVVHREQHTLVHREDLEGPLPPVPQASLMPLSRALRGVTATLAGPEDYQGPPDSGVAVVQRQLFRATGMHSASIAPIRGVRDVLGALTLGRSDRPGSFTTADLLLVEDIARRAGLALDNARLYERQRRVAETMQRHLLPQLPHVAGLEMSACYVPALDASQVGGDWYDAFLLADETPALVIGDVVGHDLDAAAGMAQVCNMLRAYAWDRQEPPSAIVNRLDEAVARVIGTSLATVIFARVERTAGPGWRLRWSNAGHPPPLLIEHDGRARFLEDRQGMLLGTGLALDRTDAVTELPPGATLVLYTDGLIESRGHSLDEGMDLLRRHAGSLARRPLAGLCDELLSRVRPADNDDDVAMLGLRLPR
ncbi:SpoIIE family protein phosphatase [Streptomyces johnsoniae]|uniref:SpoIIE family protein phosphatase n=1 Tax=Streptomyces johnsoniae TaxID=3075532 RepID=A0ABU2SCM4_9ACTN|nr:SpoIIE family protein phosphatase [Streptomyces sp. DSM 41886]MDT0445589.1 SpoIIE family protein phosphatase [Streptomyces sp. DSM 41886]